MISSPAVTASTAASCTWRLTASSGRSPSVPRASSRGSSEASVTFNILTGGQPTIEGFTGKMLYRDNMWKIDPQMLCDLIAIADAKAVCTPSPDTGAT